MRYGSRSPVGDTVGIAEALDGADAVLLAVPGAALPDLLDRYGADLNGAAPNGASPSGASPSDADPSAVVAFGAGASGAAPSGAGGVGRLVVDAGARPVRVGDLDASDVLDGVARLWFALTFGQGRGRRHGLRVLDGIRSPG